MMSNFTTSSTTGSLCSMAFFRGVGVPADLRHASDGGPERSAAGAAKADHVERSRRFGYTVAMAFFFGGSLW